MRTGNFDIFLHKVFRRPDQVINSFKSSDGTWCQRFWSTLVRGMAWCLLCIKPLPNQQWRVVNRIINNKPWSNLNPNSLNKVYMEVSSVNCQSFRLGPNVFQPDYQRFANTSIIMIDIFCVHTTQTNWNVSEIHLTGAIYRHIYTRVHINSNRACHPFGHYWYYYSGALSLCQVSVINLKIGHP